MPDREVIFNPFNSPFQRESIVLGPCPTVFSRIEDNADDCSQQCLLIRRQGWTQQAYEPHAKNPHSVGQTLSYGF